MPTIRAYDPARDRGGVRECFAQLQDFERTLDPRIPRGNDVADDYLALLFERCREFDGALLVAELDQTVVGFVAVLTRYCSPEPDDDAVAHAYVTDLVVAERHRGRGLGRVLLEAAEELAREAGAPFVRLSVKAGNQAALGLYASRGFEPYELALEKRLVGEG